MAREKRTNKKETVSEQIPLITLDFGGGFGSGPAACSCGFGRSSSSVRSGTGFDNTPQVPHDPFKMKPPSCPSLF
ncbi:MAG: hypothetical protein KC652_22450 [Cyanobacteria bacterium HKST-UBA01]|nr:hypothetical protein [Cyanobacteria bacterium HKST-UBA01]